MGAHGERRAHEASQRRLLITKIDILRVAHCVRARKRMKGSFCVWQSAARGWLCASLF